MEWYQQQTIVGQMAEALQQVTLLVANQAKRYEQACHEAEGAFVLQRILTEKQGHIEQLQYARQQLFQQITNVSYVRGDDFHWERLVSGEHDIYEQSRNALIVSEDHTFQAPLWLVMTDSLKHGMQLLALSR